MSCNYSNATRRCKRGKKQDGRCFVPSTGQRCKKKRTKLSNEDRLKNVLELDYTLKQGGLNKFGLQLACRDRNLPTNGTRKDLVERIRSHENLRELPPTRKARFVNLIEDMCPIRDFSPDSEDEYDIDCGNYDIYRPPEICGPGLTKAQAITENGLQSGDIIMTPTEYPYEYGLDIVGCNEDLGEFFERASTRQEILEKARMKFPSLDYEDALDDMLDWAYEHCILDDVLHNLEDFGPDYVVSE